MGFIRGFSAIIAINGTGIYTLTDVSVSEDTTPIPVETNGYDKVRNVPGSVSSTKTFTVLDGTDPKRAGSSNGFAMLMGYAQSRTTFTITYSNGSASFSDDVFISSFAIQNPINGLQAASVTVVSSAQDTGSSEGAVGDGSGSGDSGAGE